MNCRAWGITLGVLWLSALLRLWGLGAQSLWLDEAFSHLFASLPMDVAWPALTADAVHPPLYYLLSRLWLALAGESEFALRFPAAIAGVLTVALVLRAGKLWLGRSAARWTALILAVNPFHIWYSQEARMYTLLGLLTLAALIAFWRALHGEQIKNWIALALISAAAYVTHYFALFLPLIEFAFLLIGFRRYHRVLVRWTLAQALAALPIAVWVIWLYKTAGGSFGIGWIPPVRLDDLFRTIWSFTMAYDGRLTGVVVVAVLMWCGLLAMGAWQVRDRDTRSLLMLALLLPPLVTFLLSLRRPTYVDRFFIGVAPVFVLLAAKGLVSCSRLSRWGIAFALIGISLLGIVRFRFDPFFAKEDWRDAAALVQAHERPDDVFVLRQFQYVVPIRYYYHGTLKPEAVTLNAQNTPLPELAAGHKRLWLVLRARHDDPHFLASSEPYRLEYDESESDVRAWIAGHCVQETFRLSGLMVMLFDLAGTVCLS